MIGGSGAHEQQDSHGRVDWGTGHIGSSFPPAAYASCRLWAKPGRKAANQRKSLLTFQCIRGLHVSSVGMHAVCHRACPQPAGAAVCCLWAKIRGCRPQREGISVAAGSSRPQQLLLLLVRCGGCRGRREALEDSRPQHVVNDLAAWAWWWRVAPEFAPGRPAGARKESPPG